MGLANLVPGISGGTMILAIGLYDAFIGAVADVTRLRLTRRNVTFLGVMAIGLVLAVVTMSGVAVSLVASHRWVMYSLFIGLTLGGAPQLLRLSRPLAAPTVVAFALGLACMAALAVKLSGTSLPANMVVLTLVGAAAASSMILPGISGSTVLLMLGMYDTVIGSLSASELEADPRGALMIILPVVVGAVLGIALLANLLKALLARWSGPSHGALLGLLCGSVFVIYPFQNAKYPELADRGTRKAIEALVIEGLDVEAVRAEHGEDLAVADLEEWREEHEGKNRDELKDESGDLVTFPPGGKRVALALVLLALGFAATRALGSGAPKESESDG